MTGTLATRYVSERELVYSPTVLGFPSIQGCHAITYVTDAGLFGYHNVGGEVPSQYNDRAKAFFAFVDGHPSGKSPGRALYGACFATGKKQPPTAQGDSGWTARAYGAPVKEKWLAELKAFADAVGFTGPIYGCDLGSTPALSASQIASAYVEFTRVGGKCVVQVKVWNDADASRGSVSDHVNIQYNTRKDTVENQSANTITRVNRGGVKTTYPGPLL